MSREQMIASEESSPGQLRLARAQGETLGLALEAMNEESTSGVHACIAGDFEVAVAVEEAEGTWQPVDGRLEWVDPEDENCHLEVAVRDAADGRFVPGLEIDATVIAPDGQEVGTHRQPFLWHPWLYHYGRNWTVPESGTYRVQVRIAPAGFFRHDHENGRRYEEPVELEFDHVEIEPGRKRVEE